MAKKPTTLDVLVSLWRAAQHDVEPRPTRQPVEDLERLYPHLAGRLKQCPRCGLTKPGLEGFGPRVQRGRTVTFQSYCRACRSEG